MIIIIKTNRVIIILKEVKAIEHLSTIDLSVGYGEKNILTSLEVEIPRGKITAIIGGNGCGKSTLLKALSRLIPHQKGQILLDGKLISKMATKQLAKELAILPQTPTAPEGLRVADLVGYGRYPYQTGFGRLGNEDYRIIEWAMSATGVNALKQQAIDALSGGQRQRVWIAMALAQQTDLLLLDEPTTYLDMAHQLEVLELLAQINITHGRTIVMVLHDLNHAARFADHLIAMQSGQVVTSGTPETVLVPEVLRQVFQIEATIGKDPNSQKPCLLRYDLIRSAEKASA